ncbi:MAG TPA: retropepsin-like aspartic protease [Polyangia bacterium]|nr:retropepsin-like aspartic protease [Polyangia bacterium]
MKFPWITFGTGLAAKALPAIRCAFRNGSTVLPGDVFAILDTGADSTVLPKQFASLLGFSNAHLAEITTNAVGGTVTTWKVRDVAGVAVNLGGFWLALPCLTFAERTPPLLGRDVIFANFDLWMRQGETELRPRKK